MRDPKRIIRILKLIGKIWVKDPNLRLCQLIGNCFDHLQDMYYVEDDELEQRLKEVYLNTKPYTRKQLEKVKKTFQKKMKEMRNVSIPKRLNYYRCRNFWN